MSTRRDVSIQDAALEFTPWVVTVQSILSEGANPESPVESHVDNLSAAMLTAEIHITSCTDCVAG